MAIDIPEIQRQVPFSVTSNGLESEPAPGMIASMMYWVARGSADVPPYWSRSRDAWLRNFVYQNGPLKSAINTFVNKVVTIPWHIQAYDRSINRHVERSNRIETMMRQNSGSMSSTFVRGFKQALKMFVKDYLTTDNGAFMVLMGNGPADGPIIGAPTGLLHLDSFYVTRTKNSEFPIKYLNAGFNGDNKEYKIHHSRVIEMVNLPSPEVDLNGVGLCAVSCCIEAAQELWDIYCYSSEMFGSRPPRQILYAKTGATVKNLEDAVRSWEMKIDNDNRSRFGGTMLAAPRVANQNLDLDKIPLSTMPEEFNRRDVTTINKSEIAAAFGLDMRDLSYVLGAPSRTGDAEVQDRKGRGKGVGEFVETFSEIFNYVYVNKDTHYISFDYLDDDQDEQNAEISDLKSQARERDLRSGVTTVRVEREQMWQTAEITQDQFEDMELLDGRLPEGLDVLLLFQSQDSDVQEWLDLGIDDPTDISGNDPTMMSDIIHERFIEVSRFIHEEKNQRKRRKARQALAALDKLRSMYQVPEGQAIDEQATLEAVDEGEGEVAPEENSVPGEDIEDDVETSMKEMHQKQTEIIDPLVLNFEDEIRRLVERAVRREIPRETLKDSITEAIASLVLALFLRGSGLSQAELTLDQWAAVNAEVNSALITLDEFVRDIYTGRYSEDGLGLASALTRTIAWVNVATAAFFLGMLNRSDDPFLQWNFDPLKEHCSDCLRLDGQVHRASEWRARELRPRIWTLECRGIYCGCFFVETVGPSIGNF